MSDEFVRIYVPKDLGLEAWELEALLGALDEAMQAARTGKDGDVYQITVEVPAALLPEHLEELVDSVVGVARDFEDSFPERTWDVDIAGGILSEDHSPEAAFRRISNENDRLRNELNLAEQRLEAIRTEMRNRLGHP